MPDHPAEACSAWPHPWLTDPLAATVLHPAAHLPGYLNQRVSRV